MGWGNITKSVSRTVKRAVNGAKGAVGGIKNGVGLGNYAASNSRNRAAADNKYHASRSKNMKAFNKLSSSGNLLTSNLDSSGDIIALLEKEVEMSKGDMGRRTTLTGAVADKAKIGMEGLGASQYLAAYRGYINTRGAEVQSAKAKSKTFLTGEV